MKVKELIEFLSKVDPEAVVYTNCCEASSDHEYVMDDVDAGMIPSEEVYDGKAGSRVVFVGSSNYVG